MRVLITGAHGQVGQELMHSAPASWQISGFGSKVLDISDEQQVLDTVQQLQPQLIFNAAAYTAVDKAESDQDRAYAVNQLGAHNLARAAQSIDCLLLHISTDYVFDGKHNQPYTEYETPAPNSVYGDSKWQGEKAITAICSKYIILRTSWVFGLHGNNFVKTMLRLGQQHDVLSIVSDQVGGPTSARSIAQALWQVARQYQSSGDCPWGTYHFSGSSTCSWHDFACEIFTQATTLGLIAKTPKLNPIKTCDYPTPAQRPAYSVLDNTKISQQFNIAQSDWKSELNFVLRQLKDAQ